MKKFLIIFLMIFNLSFLSSCSTYNSIVPSWMEIGSSETVEKDEKVEKDDQATKSIIEFNNKIIEDDRVKNIILPIRDGLNIVRKN